ncbi:MAG: ABC transporter ATP-binding protein [Candidatus Aminicenantes bacterium]|nr:ABC transporter ATP-binding protein [Candidatus Aminicenantes bacterium]
MGARYLGVIFAFLFVLLSSGLIRDEFETRQIEAFLVKVKIPDFFWGKILAILSVIFVAYFFAVVFSIIGGLVHKNLSSTQEVLKLLGKGCLITVYIASIGIYLSSQVKGAMNFVGIVFIFSAAMYFLLKLFPAGDPSTLKEMSIKSAVMIMFIPSLGGQSLWHNLLFIFLSLFFIFCSYYEFKRYANKNNLTFIYNENSNQTLLEVSGLRKIYKKGLLFRKEQEILRGLDIAIKKGKITGFLGPNGAGKTTTLRIILGFIKPDAGVIKCYSRKAKPEQAKQKNNFKFGYLPEMASLYPFMTVREVFEFIAKNERMTKKQASELAEKLAHKLALNDHLDKKIKTLSKGILQKVAFGVAIIGENDLLIFDEPYSGLDPLIMRDIRNFILEVKEKGTTILLSSHLLPEVERVCDEVFLIENGKICCSGEIDELKMKFRIYKAIEKKPELRNRIILLLGENLMQKGFNSFCQADLQVLLNDQSVLGELMEIPIPDIESIFLESIKFN